MYLFLVFNFKKIVFYLKEHAMRFSPKEPIYFKKIISLVVVLTIGISLSACNKNDDNLASNQVRDSKTDEVNQGSTDEKNQVISADLKTKTEKTFSDAGKTLKTATDSAEVSARIVANKVIEKMDDAAISAAVSVELIKDTEIGVFTINVDTKDGVVTLKGSVHTQAVRDRSAMIARSFSGVQSVDNRLTVKSN